MGRSIAPANHRSITGADFLQLDRADAPAGGLTDWLTRHLRRAISDGRLPVGSKLPATRVLAGELRVSRGVVTEAYQRLIEDGQLAGRGRAGTRVVAAPVAMPAPEQAGPARRGNGGGIHPHRDTRRTATPTRAPNFPLRTRRRGVRLAPGRAVPDRPVARRS